MEENPETVLIAVDTNFDTNLIVIPPRSATIADVREKIKQGHMTLYPSYGSINILSVKVELFNRYYLLEESHTVGQIFRGWQGCLHVELAVYLPNSAPASRLRLPLISAGNKAEVSPNKIRKPALLGDQEPGDRPRSSLDKAPPPVQPEVSLLGRRISETSRNGTVASQTLEVVGSQKGSDGRNSSERFFRTGSQNVILQRQAGADGQGIETVEAGLDMALDALLDVGPERPANEGRSTDRATNFNWRNVANNDTFGGTQASTQSTPRKPAGSKAQYSGGSRLSGKRKRRAGELLNLTGSQGLPGDPANSLDFQKKVGGSATKKKRIRGKCNISPVNMDENLGKAVPDVAEKIVDDKKTDIGAPNDISSSESGPDNFVRKEVEGEAKADLLGGAETSRGRMTDGITQGKPAEKAVVQSRQVGKPQAKLLSGAVNFHSSGSSTSESSAKSEAKEPVKEKAPDSNPVLKHSEAQNESSNESSSSGDSSKSYRPESSAGTRYVDEVLNKLVSLYSPIISDDSGGEQSSDASEECQPKGLRRRMNSCAVDEADNAAERNSRRGSRTTAGLNKFQHFIDSQDGLDQLLGLTLSQRKSKPSSEMEPEPQLPTAQRVALALDSFSIDVVPDTQVGNSNFDASVQGEVNTEEIMHVEETARKGLEDGGVKLMPVGSLEMRLKDESKNPRSKSKETTLSADANDDPSESLKNFASIASESARKLDLNEDFLQPKSDDSQQFQAAVQLTRLAMADEEDDAESDPTQSPKNSSMEKKKKKKKTKTKTKMKSDTSIAMSREDELSDNVENSEKIDPARSGLATASSDHKEDSPLLPAEHSPQVVGVNKEGTNLSVLRNIQGVGEQSIDHSLEKNEEEVNAVIEAIATSARKLQEENVEQQAEKERLTAGAPVADVSDALDRNQDRIEFATPGKTVEKKKPSVRRISEDKSAREKKNELDITEEGDRRDEVATVTAEKTEDVPYIEDSPVDDVRAGAEGQAEPFIIGEGRPAEKAGRKKKAKKGNRPADSPENERREERSGRRVRQESGEWIDRGSEKKQAPSGILEAEEVEADDGLGVKNETGAIITPQKKKKKKKKLKADGESHWRGSALANADEVFAEVRQMGSNSILSSYPSHAYGGLTHETLTSGPGGENFALPEGSPHCLAAKGTPVKPLVSNKKKAKRAGSLEHAAEVTAAEVELGQKEVIQATSSKPPRPRKNNTNHMPTAAEKAILVTPAEAEPVQVEEPEKYSIEKQSKELSKELKGRKLVEDLEFADVDSKDGILTPKVAVFMDDPSKKVTSPGDGPPMESVRRKKKKRTPGGVDECIPSGVLNMSSPFRQDLVETNQSELYVGTVDNSRGGTTDTPKKKKKRSGTFSAAEEEHDEALEPSCNQLGYRGGGVNEFSRDVTKHFDPVDDVFRDDRSTEGHIKSKKKRAKSEKTVSASSPTLEYPGSRPPKPKKRKHLTSQEFNGGNVNY